MRKRFINWLTDKMCAFAEIPDAGKLAKGFKKRQSNSGPRVFLGLGDDYVGFDDEYRLRVLRIKHPEIYPSGQRIILAPERLGSVLAGSDGNFSDPGAQEIDELIYHYVDDDAFDHENDETIARHHLDEKFKLVGGDDV